MLHASYKVRPRPLTALQGTGRPRPVTQRVRGNRDVEVRPRATGDLPCDKSRADRVCTGIADESLVALAERRRAADPAEVFPSELVDVYVPSQALSRSTFDPARPA